MIKKESTFADYVQRLQSAPRLQSTSQKHFRSTQLPKLHFEQQESPYMLTQLNRAKFPTQQKLNNTLYICGQKNFQQEAFRFVKELMDESVVKCSPSKTFEMSMHRFRKKGRRSPLRL